MSRVNQERRFTKGDTLVSLYAQLKDGNGDPIDITGNTITFHMTKQSDNSVKVNNQSASIVDAATGKVRYDWASADVDTVADYYGWFIRTVASKPEHFPGQGKFLIIRIVGAPV
jgi:hypothetical protein